MADSIFLKPAEFYQRDVNPLGHYVEQNSFYLSKVTGRPIERCRSFVRQGIRQKTFKGVVDPVIHHFERDEHGDREPTCNKLSSYISDAGKQNLILVPTFTAYIPTSQKESLLVEFVDGNVKKRSINKKAAAKAKAEGDISLYINKNNEQDNNKRYNNSLSGTFGSEGNVLRNPTAHNTLTSIIRTVSSLGNGSNEKIIAGNRHYRSPDITMYNIIAMTTVCDKEAINQVLAKYRLKVPSVDDVMDCITYSSDLYWRDGRAKAKIREFVEKLDDAERATVVYTGDLYHIRIHNESFVRGFIKNLSKQVDDVYMDNAIDILYKTDEQVVNYVHQICMSIARGIGKDYAKLDLDGVTTMAATALNVVNVIEEHRDLINTFFLSKVVPSSTAFIRDMVRRSVVLSDTDSTMFSVDEWVQWYFGDLRFTDEAYAVAGAVMFIATQCIAHSLAMFSANMNVERKKLFSLAMKPEYVFPVFAQTSVAKHYFTCIAVKEGSVYKTLEMEIKGVHLKNSASPRPLVAAVATGMEDILKTILSGKKISIVDKLTETAETERSISNSLMNDEPIYYKKSKIKDKTAYSRTEELSPYLHHLFWCDIFSQKYGQIDPPPYGVIKIPTTLLTKTDVKNWVEGIEDKLLAGRLSTWLAKYKKLKLPTIYISHSYLLSYGVPKEIKQVINVKKIQLDLTNSNRLILETLGYFPKPKLLISEVGY